MSYKSLEDSVFHKEWKEEVKKEFDRVVELLKPDVAFEEVGLSDWFGGHSSIIPLLARRKHIEQEKQLPDEVVEAMDLEYPFMLEHPLLVLPEGKTNLCCITANNSFSPTLYAEIEKVMKKHPCKVILIDHLGAVV